MAAKDDLAALSGSDAPSDVLLALAADIAEARVELIDIGSTATQVPSGLDSPLDVNYGGTAGTGSDPASVDANGIVTFNQAGYYVVRIALEVARVGAGGTAFVYSRLVTDPGTGSFTVEDTPTVTILSTDDFTIPEILTARGVYAAGARVKAQIGRDSAGADAGGLYANVASGLGWGSTYSARCRVYGTGL